ncbi:MAG: MogA/MoaB family molybdenum cofactor biosynthesis protein [archaeon]
MMCDNCGKHEPASTRSHKQGTMKRIGFGIITVSSSKFRGEGTDASGDVMAGIVENEGHSAAKRAVVDDDAIMIKEKVLEFVSYEDVDAVVTSGGTGLAPRDVTIEALRGVFDKEMTGFNPVFMKLSHGRIGTACVLSRATAGIVRGKAVFCLPGSPDACRLAMEEIIIPEAGHILKHAGE